MPKYGLISETDAKKIESTIDLICNIYFIGQEINVTEIGLYSGLTSNGIYEYVTSKKYGILSADKSALATTNNVKCNYIGIDNNKDGELLMHFPKEGKLIIGNSTEVYNQIPDNSQHLIFIDGCHTFPAVIADFFCYAPKVKNGGYIAFHDTGKHIVPIHGWQGVGDKEDTDMCLGGVRKALNSIGLLKDRFSPSAYLHETISRYNWELIFDEADINDEAGGICVFKKLF